MVRRLLGATTALLLTAAAVTGCAGTAAPAAAGDTVTLSLVAYSTPQAAYEALIKAFQATPDGKHHTSIARLQKSLEHSIVDEQIEFLDPGLTPSERRGPGTRRIFHLHHRALRLEAAPAHIHKRVFVTPILQPIRLLQRANLNRDRHRPEPIAPMIHTTRGRKGAQLQASIRLGNQVNIQRHPTLRAIVADRLTQLPMRICVGSNCT